MIATALPNQTRHQEIRMQFKTLIAVALLTTSAGAALAQDQSLYIGGAYIDLHSTSTPLSGPPGSTPPNAHVTSGAPACAAAAGALGRPCRARMAALLRRYHRQVSGLAQVPPLQATRCARQVGKPAPSTVMRAGSSRGALPWWPCLRSAVQAVVTGPAVGVGLAIGDRQGRRVGRRAEVGRTCRVPGAWAAA